MVFTVGQFNELKRDETMNLPHQSLKRAALRFWGLVSLLCLNWCISAAEPALDPASVDFFETKIRPILAEQCYSCHSQRAEKLKGGLYLDTKDGLLKGGDNGPAIVPGNPDKSLLIKAVRYTDENLQMPPKNKKLTTEQIADLEHWVKIGAPDPRTGANAALAEREAKVKNHWAFQPIRKPELPAVKNPSWVKTPIDAFILAALERNALTPSPVADKRTLIRRATFDLLGLPPSPEDVAAFEHDNSDRAYEKLIERLLASPQYGERWARHWLDVARYADTKGYVFEEERRYPYSYTYRDYVIRALNDDLPFDRFIIEQLAADLLPLGEDKRPLAAMGFLTLGRRFLNSEPDIIDDRIDVTTRGFMGLTVQCARCHDHKFDPIPTEDYYSLYGVFASSSEPSDKPLLGTASLPKDYPGYIEERKKREDELNKFRAEKESESLAQLRAKASEYMLTALEAIRLNDSSKNENLAKQRKLDPGVMNRWKSFLEERAKNTNDPIFAPWFAFAALTEPRFTNDAPALFRRFTLNETSNPINPIVAKAFAGESPASMQEVADRYKKAFAEVDDAWVAARKDKSDLDKLANGDQESIRQILYASTSPSVLPSDQLPRLFDVPAAQKNRALKRKVEELDATHPGAPPRGMTLAEKSQPYEPRVFVRGNARNHGQAVPRQFLQIATAGERKPFAKGGGRLEMAEAIASPSNPLTARVIVNRVWLNHFGQGIVRTPSDFGVRADAPSHPELLDYLAAQFIADGWSLKKLHRAIMLSSTYQQVSDDRPDYAQKDPGNALLWRMNRRRLELEPFRDTLLAVGGKLDLQQGGQPVDIIKQPFTTRRTVYSYIERQNLPGLLRTFDFASPDSTSPQRFTTTVPQQALFMINSPFVVEQSRGLAARPEVQAQTNPEKRVAALYQAALQRQPTADETALASAFVAEQAKLPPVESPAETWRYGYGSFDPATHTLTKFTPLPHFTGKAWQGGGQLPDKELGWALLNAQGGHPGEGLDRVVVRRWTSPKDGPVSISGTLGHESGNGDGVRGRIISSRFGELGFWPVYHGQRAMDITRLETKKGDIVDFVVDMNTTIHSDSFTWAPVIQSLAATSSSASTSAWKAQDDFASPKEPVLPLTPWEKLAQVLLMSNELAFVD